ncbi:MAG: hypothetical protein ACRDNI_12805 [Gaiellaceae bacterium]
MGADLTAEFTVEPRRTARREDLVARGGLQNRGDDPIELDPAPLSSPSLALEIVDASGSPVHLPPPPVPGGEAPLATLAMGERRPVEFAGFLPSWTPAGAYRARLRYVGLVAERNEPERTVEVVSDWAEFVVTDQ